MTMKVRYCLAAFAVVALVAITALRAADKPELKCPLSGKPVDETKTVEFNGGTVAFCCGNCPKAFAKNKEKFAAKANLQLVQSGQLKQVKCPLTGRPMNPEKVVKLDGAEVSVCCAGCLGKVEKLASDDEKIELLLSDTSKGFKPAKE
jgi:ribosome-binding protein aMBF1 (putative translation factor)